MSVIVFLLSLSYEPSGFDLKEANKLQNRPRIKDVTIFLNAVETLNTKNAMGIRMAEIRFQETFKNQKF